MNQDDTACTDVGGWKARFNVKTTRSCSNGVGVMGSILRTKYFNLKWHQLSRAPVMAWVGTIRRESTREERARYVP